VCVDKKNNYYTLAILQKNGNGQSQKTGTVEHDASELMAVIEANIYKTYIVTHIAKDQKNLVQFCH